MSNDSKITVGQLLKVININGDERIQVCNQYGDDWNEYDDVSAESSLLDAISACEVKVVGAIKKDIIRIDIDWSEFNKGEEDA